MTFIVDTNVAIVANEERSEDRSLDCIDACIRNLEEIMRAGRIAMDDEDRILEEYEPYMQWHGPRGTGHEFFIWVINNLWNKDRCDRVSMPEFPEHPSLSQFDQSDRKFVRVSLGHPDNPPILVAADRGWRRHKDALASQVTIDFLCEVSDR